MPGATNVVTRQVDVPSPQFPGLWQEGVIAGYFYMLFANGEGVLQSARDAPDWAITFTCDEATKTCETVQERNEAPADAAAIKERLERCFIAPETAGEPIASAAPPQILEALAPDTLPVKTEAPPSPCGLGAVPEGPQGKTLQRLVVLGGADPGPIDGFLGKRTQAAIVELLGQKAQTMPIPEAIIALDQLLCGQKIK